MNHLYYRLAVTNLRNNKQFYVPYILAGMVSAMMFYIMRAVQGNDSINSMRGASILGIVLLWGFLSLGRVCLSFCFIQTVL